METAVFRLRFRTGKHRGSGPEFNPESYSLAGTGTKIQSNGLVVKAILEFDLPEDQAEFDACSRGKDWAMTIFDVDREIRDWLKYETRQFDNPRDALDAVRLLITEVLDQKLLEYPM